eukprot:CFRG2014T1
MTTLGRTMTTRRLAVLCGAYTAPAMRISKNTQNRNFYHCINTKTYLHNTRSISQQKLNVNGKSERVSQWFCKVHRLNVRQYARRGPSTRGHNEINAPKGIDAPPPPLTTDSFSSIARVSKRRRAHGRERGQASTLAGDIGEDLYGLESEWESDGEKDSVRESSPGTHKPTHCARTVQNKSAQGIRRVKNVGTDSDEEMDDFLRQMKEDPEKLESAFHRIMEGRNEDTDKSVMGNDQVAPKRQLSKKSSRAMNVRASSNASLYADKNEDVDAQLDMLLKNMDVGGGSMGDSDSDDSGDDLEYERKRLEKKRADKKINKDFDEFSKKVRENDDEVSDSQFSDLEDVKYRSHKRRRDRRGGKMHDAREEQLSAEVQYDTESRDIDEAIQIMENPYELDSEDEQEFYADQAKKHGKNKNENGETYSDEEDWDLSEKYKFVTKFKTGKYPHFDNLLSGAKNEMNSATPKSKKVFSRYEREKLDEAKRAKLNKSVVIDVPFALDKARAGGNRPDVTFGLGGRGAQSNRGQIPENGGDGVGVWDAGEDVAFMGLASPRKGMKGKWKSSDVRNTRVSSLIYKAINEVIVTDVRTNPKLGHLNIDFSHIDIADYHATLYWRNLGQEQDKYVDRTLKALTKELRYKIQQRINLKRAPKLEFRQDMYERSVKNLSQQFMELHTNPNDKYNKR